MQIIKEKTISFAGNRKLISSSIFFNSVLESQIFSTLYSRLEDEYLKNGIDTFLCGLSLGFDILAAKVILHLQIEYPSIRLIAVVPFIDRERDHNYSAMDKKDYRDILYRANYSVVMCSAGESLQAYKLRNEYIATHASKIYAFHNGVPNSGGTTLIRIAKIHGVEVDNLYQLFA